MSAAADVRAGLLIGARRLVPRMPGLAGGTALLTLTLALVERKLGDRGGIDRALHIVASWFMPLLALAVVTAAVGTRPLRELTWPAARFGASRQAVAVGLVVAMSLAAVVAILPSIALAYAAGPSDSSVPLGRDLATSGWVAAESAWAYAAWLALGATFGKQGGGRGFVIVAD